jgi:hypothetical protein
MIKKIFFITFLCLNLTCVLATAAFTDDTIYLLVILKRHWKKQFFNPEAISYNNHMVVLLNPAKEVGSVIEGNSFIQQ